MRKIMIAGMIALITAAGCNNPEQEARIASLSIERDSLVIASVEKDQSLDEFIDAFEEIESNLATITDKQLQITRETENNPEFSKTASQRINEEIALIAQLMDESKEEMANLEKKVKKSNSRISKFKKIVASLNAQIAAKDTEMVVLNEKILALNNEVVSLNNTVTTLQIKDSVNSEFIAEQGNMMNTAYVAVGPYKSLRDNNVVRTKGGFLGLGKEKALSETLDKEAFTQIDIRQISSIPIQASEAELVTVHPEGSYSIESNENSASELKITNPDEFWSTSKYLVVMTH